MNTQEIVTWLDSVLQEQMTDKVRNQLTCNLTKSINDIKENSIIQVNEKAKRQEYIGCLFQVTERKVWGVIAELQVPQQGYIPVRFEWDEIDYIGEAVMTKKFQ